MLLRIRFPLAPRLIIFVALLLHVSVSRCGDLRISGSNVFGQIGTGESDTYSSFVQIATDVVDVDLGFAHAVFSDTSGRLWGLGAGWYGQLGDVELEDETLVTSTPVLIAENVVNFHANYIWTFYSDASYRLFGMGDGSANPFWDGSKTRFRAQSVFDLSNIVKMDSWWTHAIYLHGNSRLYGVGSPYALGVAGNEPIGSPRLIAENVVDAATSGRKSYYVTGNGELMESTSSSYVSIATNVIKVFAEYDRMAFITDSNELYVKGGSLDGALGLGVNKLTVQDPHFLAANVREVELGARTTFFLDGEDVLWGTGENLNGMLANGEFSNQYSPIRIRENVRSIAANESNLFVVDNDGTLHASGLNNYSILGFYPVPVHHTPRLLRENIKQAVVGNENVFFIANDESLWALGKNNRGQLGTSDTENRTTPALVYSNIKSVSSDHEFTVFVTNTNILLGVGGNNYGHLGLGEASTAEPIVIATETKSAVVAESAVLFIKEDNTLWYVGKRDGVGLTREIWFEDNTATPIMIASDVMSVAAAYNTFFITMENELKVVGRSYFSGYEEATGNTLSEEPHLIDFDVAAVASAYEYAAFVKEDGTLWLVGNLSFYQDNRAFAANPIQIDSDVAKVECSVSGVVYQKNDGTLWLVSNRPLLAPLSIVPDADAPVQIWKGAVIEDFSIQASNAAYVTAPVSAPEGLQILKSSETPISVGEKITLTSEITAGAFPVYQWYNGEIGDRSNPIVGSEKSYLEVYPYANTSYWVDVFNEAGSASPEVTLGVEISDSAYGLWATGKGLVEDGGLQSADGDHDDISNLYEYLFDLDPARGDGSVMETRVIGDEKLLEITYPRTPEELQSIVPQGRFGGAGEWQDLESLVSLSFEETETENRLTIPFEMIDTNLQIRLNVESAE